MRTCALSALVATLLLLPVALACTATTTTTLPGSDATYYVASDGSVWMETNGLHGLQCSPMVLGGRLVPADTRVTL